MSDSSPPPLPARSRKPRLWLVITGQKDRSSSPPNQKIHRSVTWDLPPSPSPESTSSAAKDPFVQRDSEDASRPATPRSPVTSSALSDTSELPNTSETPESVRVKVCALRQRKKPVLRRCHSPIEDNLREICKRQSEDNLRDVYEAQTMTYLNDEIYF